MSMSGTHTRILAGTHARPEETRSPTWDVSELIQWRYFEMRMSSRMCGTLFALIVKPISDLHLDLARLCIVRSSECGTVIEQEPAICQVQRCYRNG
jgi:hypothetical protein